MAVRLVVRRRTPNEYSANTYFTAAFNLRHRGRDVSQFDGAETDEPLRIVAGILGGPVVEPAKACGAKLGIVEPEEQHSHRGVHRLGVDAVAILLLEAFGRVPHALGGNLEAALAMLRQFLGGLAGTEEAGDLDRVDILADEKLALRAVQVFLRMRGAVAKLLIDALSPHVGRFDKV